MITDLLKEEIKKEQPGEYCPDHFRSLGYEASRNSAAALSEFVTAGTRR